VTKNWQHIGIENRLCDCPRLVPIAVSFLVDGRVQSPLSGAEKGF